MSVELVGNWSHGIGSHSCASYFTRRRIGNCRKQAIALKTLGLWVNECNRDFSAPG
jgi:hypothetical protein